jgi:hypothetical protein
MCYSNLEINNKNDENLNAESIKTLPKKDLDPESKTVTSISVVQSQILSPKPEFPIKSVSPGRKVKGFFFFFFFCELFIY